MNFGLLRRGEIIAMVGGLALLIGMFTKWYEARPQNPNANIDGARGTLSAWDVHQLLRVLFLIGAIAPFILAYIIVRDHQLSWPRGELTAIIGIFLTGFVVYVGVIDRPGDPSGEIELEFGWYIALLGTILILAGGASRSSESERKRKPPGVL